MRVIPVIILFTLVCVVSSAITYQVLTPEKPPASMEAQLLAAPDGFVATRTSGGNGIFYQRQAIATLPSQPAPAAFPKTLQLSEQAKCRLTLAQDRSSQNPEKVKVMDEYCNKLMAQEHK
ncbi:MAG: hypothetical protein AAGC84_18960 [Pseudomonas sp.]